MTVLDRLSGAWRRIVTPPPPPSSLPRPVERAIVSPAPMPVRAPLLLTDAIVTEPALPRRERVYDAFDSSMPVATRTGLAGREAELERLSEAVLLRRSHAIVFGPRGSGKTSLARIFGDVADDMRALVLYNLASGETNFASLFRPYLFELARELPPGGAKAAIERLAGTEFDARALASLLVEMVTQTTVLVLDEFDRVESQGTKAEVAALMKLLSDMRGNVRVLLVGIAGNVEDLLQGHPSLRRHMVTVPIGGIDSDSMRLLLGQLVARAGMTVTAGAVDLITGAAAGSPYHVRLFGLHAALAALKRRSIEITEEMACVGLQDALGAWRELGGTLDPAVTDALSDRTAVGYATAAACWLAVSRLRIDRGELAAYLAENLEGEGVGQAEALADAALALLRHDLTTTASDEAQLVFIDTLKPQFLLQIYRGTVTARKPAAPPGEPLLLAQAQPSPGEPALW